MLLTNGHTAVKESAAEWATKREWAIDPLSKLSGAPGAIPTRDLPLRSQSRGVYLRYLRVSQTARSVGVH
jgi:hypothetical protein